jgi:ComF family protein
LDLLRAAFLYRDPLPRLLYAFKYAGRPEIGRTLADWTAAAFLRAQGFADADALVPVPLHARRQRHRGFNQALVLAQGLSRASRLPVLEALARTRATLPQWRFGREDRLHRLEGAFSPRTGVTVRGRSLILVDDVATTGGTLEACAHALRRAGARTVKAFVLARG